MSSAPVFERGILDFLADQVVAGHFRLSIRTANKVFEAARAFSPVDTGFFQQNWRISFKEPDLSVTFSREIGRQDPNRKREPLSERSYRKGKEFRNVWVYNRTIYAEPLENGYSAQAPGGVLGPAIIAAGAIEGA